MQRQQPIAPDGDAPGKTLAERVTRRVSALSPWQARLATLAAGAVSVLAMAPFHFWPVLWLTLPVLCCLIDAASDTATTASRWTPWRRTRVGRIAETGWWFGFGYHLAGLFWIGEAFLVEAEVFAWLLPFAVTLLPAGLAFFTALATASVDLVRHRPPFERVLALAIGFGATEWLRGHILTGFPWNVLGYALTSPLALMQSAAVFGIYGLTVVTVVVFAGPFALLQGSGRTDRHRIVAALACMCVPLTLMFAAGTWRLSHAPAAENANAAHRPKFRVVQASIPQRDRMLPENRRAIFDEHLALSLQAPDGTRDDAVDIDLLVWPEAAMPFLPLREPVALDAIGALLRPGMRLVSGALRIEPSLEAPDRRVFNSLFVFEGGASGQPAKAIGLYDKLHLVPFGEYLPAQSFLEAIGLQQITRQRGGFAPGERPRTALTIPGVGQLWPWICYEAVFPDAAPTPAARPDLLLTLTNDGWFGRMTGPWQHYHQARVRSVETGIPLLRASGNGISAMIDGLGREQAKLALDAKGTMDATLPSRLPPPPYATQGDKLFLLLTAFLAALLLFRRTGY